jgi:hypothetical protein
MRYFQSTPEVFDAFRDTIINMLGLPADGTTQPWDVGITLLPLAPHEYNDPRYQPMIEQAIADKIVAEITESQYRELSPPTDRISP